ncbi:MAG TPA: thiol:disulfide interchange protein DsbA/DsbL [Gammaproteobacteria bacterium]
MNCDTIDSLLDDHLVARLSASERQRAADHVGGCERCSAAWAADEALRGETIADPAPELFAALRRRVSAAPAQSETTRSRRWASLAAAAAAVAIVAVAARWAAIEPEGAAPPEVSPAPSTVAASPFVAGRDYEVLPGAAARLGAPARGGAVEVVEFFMFWCVPCYAFEPDLNRWEAETRSSVSLTRVPAMFNPEARLHARAYYTAEALGKLDAMRTEMYDEIHLRGHPLGSRGELADFFQRLGVDRATFDATFDSSEVDARVQRAVALNREYSISATPTMVIAGRYSTNPSLAFAVAGSTGWAARMLAVVEQLVADERRCQTRCDGVRPVVPEQPR